MFKFKFVLPMLAFVLAIGMSFAFVGATEDDYYVTGYVNHPVIGWIAVDVDCNAGSENCRVQFVDENGAETGAPLQVYPQQSEQNPMVTDSQIPFKIVR